MRPIRQFPKLKKIVQKKDGTILAKFKYDKYKKSDAFYSTAAMIKFYSELVIFLTYDALKIRIKTFKEKGWPVAEEEKALRYFHRIGL